MANPSNGISIMDVIIAAAAIVSTFFIYRAARIARKTMKHERLSKLREEYRSDEMGRALMVVGSCKKYLSSEAVETFRNSQFTDKDKCLRKASHFYNELADLYAYWVLRPKKLIFNV
jgi:hypothetical protein